MKIIFKTFQNFLKYFKTERCFIDFFAENVLTNLYGSSWPPNRNLATAL